MGTGKKKHQLEKKCTGKEICTAKIYSYRPIQQHHDKRSKHSKSFYTLFLQQGE